MASAQRKSSKPEACRKASAKVITLNVSKGIIKEIFELFTNKLWLYEFSKNEVADPNSSREKCIFMDYDYDERVFVFDLFYFVK